MRARGTLLRFVVLCVPRDQKVPLPSSWPPCKRAHRRLPAPSQKAPGRLLCSVKAWPPLGPQPQPQHRSLFLCSSTPATDRSASPLSLPPLAAGKGHLRWGRGDPWDPGFRGIQQRPSHPRWLPGPCSRWFLCPLPTSLHPIGTNDSRSLWTGARVPVHSLFILSFPRVLPESFPHTGIPASPWGTRCLLLWSNLSAPTLSLSGCVCVKYPTSCVFAGCQRAGGLGRAFFSGAVGRELCTPF